MDKLVVEGVLSKGYGTIPKAIMLWPAEDVFDEHGKKVAAGLSVTSKVIYGYFASYSGIGSIAFPGRDKICEDLGITKDTYLKYRKPLETNGLLKVIPRRKSGGFSSNIFLLSLKPDLHEAIVSIIKLRAKKNGPCNINQDGINFAGYGTCPKLVMAHRDLSLFAKAIYLYLSSWTGGDSYCTPDKPDILSTLGLSEASYSRHTKSLKDRGFIKVEQKKVEGYTYPKNVYSVLLYPKPVTLKPVTLKQDTLKQDTLKQDTEKNKENKELSKYDQQPVTLKQDTLKQDTNKNNQSFLIKKQQPAVVVDDSSNSFKEKPIAKSNICELVEKYTEISGCTELRESFLLKAMKKHNLSYRDVLDRLAYLEKALKDGKVRESAIQYFSASLAYESVKVKPEKENKTMVTQFCEKCNYTQAACICNTETEMDEETRVIKQLRDKAKDLGEDPVPFMYLAAEIQENKIKLYAANSFFTEKITRFKGTIERVINAMDTPFELHV